MKRLSVLWQGGRTHFAARWTIWRQRCCKTKGTTKDATGCAAVVPVDEASTMTLMLNLSQYLLACPPALSDVLLLWLLRVLLAVRMSQWSLGNVAYELLTGLPPFYCQGKQQFQYLQHFTLVACVWRSDGFGAASDRGRHQNG